MLCFLYDHCHSTSTRYHGTFQLKEDFTLICQQDYKYEYVAGAQAFEPLSCDFLIGNRAD